MNPTLSRNIFDFCFGNNISYRNYINNATELIDDKLFKLFLTYKKRSDNMYEIPLVLEHNLSTVTLNTLSNSYNKRRTFSVLLRGLKTFSHISNLIKVKYSHDIVYYGYSGLILDAEFKPMLLVTRLWDLITHDIKKIIVRISPRVFMNDNPNIMEKGIRTYLLNKCSNTFVHTIKPIILIDDEIDNFFIRPTAPSNINTNEEIQKMLLNNIDTICL